jgi:adenylosuccinate synthase
MKTGQLNVCLDESWGSSGKGKLSTYLADKFGITCVSSSNFPNAGHTAEFGNGYKFVAKAIPTALALHHAKGIGLTGFISPGSGFDTKQLFKEWIQTGKPFLFIHDRASIVTQDHARREREGQESTKHIASTMQGSGTAYADKILRKSDVPLAGSIPTTQWDLTGGEILDQATKDEFVDKVKVVSAYEFRNLTHNILDAGQTWLHEGSQGYALSIDHGSHYPQCTSRNCTVQAALDHLAVAPQKLGDVYLNMRSYPIRVGNVVEDGVQKGFSGDFMPDSREVTWEEIATKSGMPSEEAARLAERERTTVTKRIRRVATRSDILLKDAVRVNGVTKLAMNFVQYWNWKDAGLKGGREAFEKLSKETRAELAHIEELVNIPVTIIGTGALHDEVIDLES